MNRIVDALGELEPQDDVRLTLDDDSTVEGAVAVVDYVPDESLHVEIEATDGETTRYRVLSNYADDGWATPDVERTEPTSSDAEWEALADVDSVAVSRDMVGSVRDVYALQVRGDSMIDALINDGDIVVMRHQQTAENGDMVAAWVKDEKSTTLKRFYWESGRTMVRLQPANPTMDPIYVHPRNLEIQGKVVGVIRRLS